jgi:hypothetical protein
MLEIPTYELDREGIEAILNLPDHAEFRTRFGNLHPLRRDDGRRSYSEHMLMCVEIANPGCLLGLLSPPKLAIVDGNHRYHTLKKGGLTPYDTIVVRRIVPTEWDRMQGRS